MTNTNYGPYMDDMFALENFTYTFCTELINIINSNPPTKIHQEILMLKYN